MKRTSNSDCRNFVEEKVAFKANNIFSEWRDGKYVVYSYGKHFPMYIYKTGKWYENSDKYSRSTSKQQTQARPFNFDLIHKTTREMQEIIFTD